MSKQNTITAFFEHDHDRLDELFETFQQLKRSDFPKAKDAFKEFKFGLQRHIVWEEDLLFHCGRSGQVCRVRLCASCVPEENAEDHKRRHRVGSYTLPTDRRSEMKKKTTKSSGNVFVDLGFDPAEAAVLQMRANLMSDLRLYIEKQKLTQAQAAKRLGIAQSRVSDSCEENGTSSALKCLLR
jgi:predicted XRE-type DNA-binding protein